MQWGGCPSQSVAWYVGQTFLYSYNVSFNALWYFKTMVTQTNAQFYNLCIFFCYLSPTCFSIFTVLSVCRARLKHDGTRAETRYGLSAKRASPFKLVGGSFQSTTGSWGVRISGSNGSNAGYTMFWGRVQDYWLPTPLACFPFTSPPVRHRVPSGFNWALPQAVNTV